MASTRHKTQATDRDAGTLANEVLDGLDGGADAGVIGDLLSVKGDIDVATDKDLLALELVVGEVLDGLLRLKLNRGADTKLGCERKWIRGFGIEMDWIGSAKELGTRFPGKERITMIAAGAGRNLWSSPVEVPPLFEMEGKGGHDTFRRTAHMTNCDESILYNHPMIKRIHSGHGWMRKPYQKSICTRAGNLRAGTKAEAEATTVARMTEVENFILLLVRVMCLDCEQIE